jgi:hypothetical protein
LEMNVLAYYHQQSFEEKSQVEGIGV